MSIEKRKLSEVTLAESATEAANILIEEDGAIKRVSLESIKAAILGAAIAVASNQDAVILAEAQAYTNDEISKLKDEVNAAIEAADSQTTE